MKKVFLLIAAVFLSISTFSQVNLNEGLVAYYPFNGNANDESGNGHDGTEHGVSLTTDRFGNENTAFNFGGSGQYLSVSHDPSFNSENVTISCWVYSNQSISNTKGIIFKAPNTGTNREFGLSVGDDSQGHSNVWFDISNGNSIVPNVSNSEISSDRWYHFVGVIMDFNKTLLYINNELENEVAIDFAHLRNSNEIVIGKVSSSSFANRYWNGKIDDIRIYNRALSEQEIQSLYNENQPTFTCGQPFTDHRDGKSYQTVPIGNQCWMKKNLNIGEMLISSQTSSNNNVIEKYCFNDDPTNCEIYGGLYRWDELMDYSILEGTQGICPNGWHVPTDAEWNSLEGKADSQFPVGDPIWLETGRRGFDVGGNLKMKGTTLWNPPNDGATNNTGFTVLPGGNMSSGGGFGNMGLYSYHWTSSQTNLYSAYYHRYEYNTARAYRTIRNKAYGLSVRCVYDEAISFSVNFKADKTEVSVNEPVQFTDLSTGNPMPNNWTWQFEDFSACAITQNPVHSFNKSGTYDVTLTVANNNGQIETLTKEDYITVVPVNHGIRLHVIKTDPSNEPNIAKIGYNYKTENDDGYLITSLVTTEVIDGEAIIDSFPALEALLPGHELVTSFNNEILLFDQDNNQIGHIHYDYSPEQENECKRDAILLLHNDDTICKNNAYPYSLISTEYDAMWEYYKIGEYPVSMLIPPNNTLQSNYNKTPLLLVHGWEGRYKLISHPDAVAKDNETSYWFTTAKELNKEDSEFDTWQFYYPYNDAHKHIAVCLESTLDTLKSYYPSDKIRIVTHSMGGLVTMRYLTQFPDSAIDVVEKVLFSAPPAHGSLGANLYYKTKYSPEMKEYLHYDDNAPSVRDLKLGSDATWYIYNKDFPDLNASNGFTDDYFVLLGTTFNWYMSDLKYQAIFKRWVNSHLISHSSAHTEASHHHDGIVAISSGSLLDKGIGFATFHGNHNDAVHMQSFLRGDQTKQNIGDQELLPDIITAYFTQSQVQFLNTIKGKDEITAVVQSCTTVLKPEGQNLETLNTNNDVEYQKGIINISLSQNTSIGEYNVYYRKRKDRLIITPIKFNLLNKIFAGYSKLGVFRRVINKGTTTNNYYFNDKVLIAKGESNLNRAITYNGCAMELEQGEVNICIENENGDNIATEKIDFGYCQTVNEVFNIFNKDLRNDKNNNSDTKYKIVQNEETSLPDSICTPFFIDDQTSSVKFAISSFDAVADNIPIYFKLKLPDGTIADSTFPGSFFEHNTSLGNLSMDISNPEPGLWHIWLESDQLGNDTLLYNSMAYFQTEIIAHVVDSIKKSKGRQGDGLTIGLKVNDFNLTSDVTVTATVYPPDSEEEFYDLSSNFIVQDSSFIFSEPYSFNISGEYKVKYNVNGVYDSFSFERCIVQLIQIVDTIPRLSIPDITLRQNQNYLTFNLNEYLYNVDKFDTIYYISNILSSNIANSAFNLTFDSTNLITYAYSNLSDTGTVVVNYTCHFDNITVSDTVLVNILLPDISIDNLEVSTTTAMNLSDLALNYSLMNTGNYYSGSYEIKYFISTDSIIQVSDLCLGSRNIPNHATDSIISIYDTLGIPNVEIFGEKFLIIKVDANEDIIEVDENNNRAFNIIILNSQVIDIPEGWSGISSYFKPVNDTIEDIVDKVVNDLVILQNDSGFYWPGQNINTLATWNTHEGYQIKVANDVELTISGLRENNKTLQLASGWILIPVLSECDIETEVLFDAANVVIIKEVAGWNVYWPEFGINTLGVLEPGKAYFVLMNGEADITFPECASAKGTHIKNQQPQIPEGFNLIKTAASHTIALPKTAFSLSDIGSIITANDANGNCFGVSSWNGENTSITLFGDDPLTDQKDGFFEGEEIRFDMLSLENSLNLKVEFDQSLPQYDGMFHNNGLSAIKVFGSGSTGIGNIFDSNFEVYPNPADEVLNVSKYFAGKVELSIISIQGIKVFVSEFVGLKTEIDIKALPSGLYFVQMKGDLVNGIKRVVIR